MNKLSVKFITLIACLIIVVEGVLLVYSIRYKEDQLNTLQRKERDNHSLVKVITPQYIENELKSYQRNIIFLTVVVILCVTIGTFFIYRQLVGKYIARIANLNRMDDPGKTRFAFKKIPNDEIGELINSRFLMLDLLENTINENKNLIRILVHDLNNSLTLITNANSLVCSKGEEKGEKFRQRMYEKISRGVLTQSNIIKSVRELESIKSGKKELVAHSTSILQVFDDALFMFEDKLEMKGLKLILEMNRHDDLCVFVEPITFTNNVFFNLITNAIKFSKKGEKIIVNVTKGEANTVVIKISDKGIGIPDDLIQILFSPSKKTSRVGTDGEKGTGFGMPLVYSTLKMLRGSIEVSSKTIEEFPEDHGTTFTMILPRINSKV